MASASGSWELCLHVQPGSRSCVHRLEHGPGNAGRHENLICAKDPAVTSSHRPPRGVLESSRAKDGGRVDVRGQSVGLSVRVEERVTDERAPQRGRWSDEPFEAGVPVP